MTDPSVWLVVPIDVEALCVGGPDTDTQGGPPPTVGPLADFSQLADEPYVGRAVAAPPLAGEQPLAEGIHVHWALPDALTQGLQDETGVVDFPAVPNRWLVTRILVPASGPPPAPASWVVESDRLSTTPQRGIVQSTVPAAPGAPAPSFRYIGTVTPLAEWSEQPGAERLTPLTAVGYGEPTFAAFYPACSAVFGFHDALTDVPEATLQGCTIAYHVAGWYAAGDPLADAALDPANNPYAWRFDAGPPPNRTLCGGIVHGIAFDPSQSYLGDDIPVPRLALGGSTAEALSALLANELPGLDNAEALLNALQFGLLGRDHQIGALERFEEAVHAAGFDSFPGGRLWTIRAADEGEELTLPDQLATPLDELNAQQAAYDAAALELAGMRRQLFLDWCKFLQLTGAPGYQAGDSGAAAAYLQQQATAIGNAAGALTDAASALDGASRALAGMLEESMTLTPEPLAPRYYAASDPVLVLHGEAAQPAFRYGGDGLGNPQGYLACRRDSELVTSIELHAGAVGGSNDVRLAASALPGLGAQPADAPVTVLTAALRDAIFLSPPLQPIVAAAIAAQGGGANPASLDLAGTISVLQAAATAFLDNSTPAVETIAGLPPDGLALKQWTGTPWLPIMVQWEVQLAPLVESGDYPPGVLFNLFGLHADSIDLECTTAPATTPRTLYGSAILTPDAVADLTNEIQQYVAATGADDPDLDDVVTQLTSLPLLSQALSGLTDALLALDPGIQLPVADPAGGEEALVAAVAAAVAGENAVGALPDNPLTPLRGGSLTIVKLRLVDAFGRVKDFAAPTPVVAAGLTPPGTAAAGTAFLPPRIASPARLLFRWRAAIDDGIEMNSHPATSPVIGWVVPDYLDNSIAVYDPDGNAVASFGLSADRRSVLFTPAPGGEFGPTATPADVFSEQQDHLREFGLGLYDDGESARLAGFFDSVRAALALSLPASFKEDAGTALLLGQPLVLARASVKLELAGPLPRDQSWSAFLAAIRNGTAPSTRELESVLFPVVLGSLAQLDDTLIGYWIQDPDGTTDYGKFDSPSAQAVPLFCSLGDDGGETVTLLLDPRGSVHATTGVVPVKSISIPPDQFAGALERIAVTLATRPLLAGSVPTLPLPGVVDGDWSWVAATRAGWAAQGVADAPLEATLDQAPQRLVEGWLRLNLPATDDE